MFAEHRLSLEGHFLRGHQGKEKRGPLKMHGFSSDLWAGLVPLSDTKTNKEVQTCRLHKQGYLATTVSRKTWLMLHCGISVNVEHFILEKT